MSEIIPTPIDEMNNPFMYNAPVKGMDFFDREKIIKELLRETVTGKSQGNVWITGERQVGKTSLLHYFQSELGDYKPKVSLYGTKDLFNVAFIYVNIQDCETRDDFYRIMRQSLKSFFDFKIKAGDKPLDDFKAALHHLHFELKYYVVFLVDEFDAFIESLATGENDSATSFLSEWNKIIQGISDFKKEAKVFGCIFAANHTIQDLLRENDIKRRGSGLVVESVELNWFKKSQVEALAKQYLENNNLQFSKKELDFCFKMTQGYPYFAQKLFSLMYEQKKQAARADESYLKQVKKDYGNIFRETIKGWGGPSMPKRTLEKLKGLAGHIIKEDGAKIFSLILKILEEYPMNAG